ncbi:hypothetical protein [Paraburkholderia youngii]|uniref:hypothetical protein n=1 Tax=Paraburkholderia youngii TaxID=2782701 RepID=UPI003D194E2A
MNALAQTIIDAHGGLTQWRKFTKIRADLSQGGALWSLKGQGGVLDQTSVTVATDRQWASHAPFGSLAARTEFTGDTISLVAESGDIIETTDTPRSSFAGHTLETPWSSLQLAFFETRDALRDALCGPI